MSIRTMTRVWDASKHSGSHLLMLLAIADFADDAGNAYPAVGTLARRCRMKPRNAQMLLAALKGTGELQIRPNEGPRGTNRYRVVVGISPGTAEGMQDCAGVQSKARVQPVAGHRAASGCAPGARAGAQPPQRLADEPSRNRQIEGGVSLAGFDAEAMTLPDWLPQAAWMNWVADLKDRQRPLTRRAAEAQLQQLSAYRDDGEDPVAVICHSIASGYRSLYPQGRGAGRGIAADVLPHRRQLLDAEDVL